MNFPNIDKGGITVVLVLVLMPVLFYLLLNIMVVVQKVLGFIEKILIRIFGEFVGRIFRAIFGVLSAIIGVLRAIVDVFRPKRSRRTQK